MIKSKKLPKGVVVKRTENGFDIDMSNIKEIEELRLLLGKLLQNENEKREKQ